MKSHTTEAICGTVTSSPLGQSIRVSGRKHWGQWDLSVFSQQHWMLVALES